MCPSFLMEPNEILYTYRSVFLYLHFFKPRKLKDQYTDALISLMQQLLKCCPTYCVPYYPHFPSSTTWNTNTWKETPKYSTRYFLRTRMFIKTNHERMTTFIVLKPDHRLLLELTVAANHLQQDHILRSVLCAHHSVACANKTWIVRSLYNYIVWYICAYIIHTEMLSEIK